ncbi:MAG: hypothetical protein ABR499_08320 [Gemmatimonadaceae bacterium]
MNGRGTRVNAHARPRGATRAVATDARRRVAVVVAASALLATEAHAQARLTRTEDAAPVPRGFARLRVIPSWSRFETHFAGSSGDGASTAPLASAIVAESLGVVQIPGLASAEEALRTLTGDPAFRLSLGRSMATAAARVVTTAFIAEYGLTRRLTVGGVLPVVQSRTELVVSLNADDDATANVGPSPGRISETGRRPADQLQQQLGSARATLQSQLDACDQNPSADPSCPTILANRDDVVSLIAETAAFGSALAVLFGTSTASAQPFVALNGTAAATDISNHLSAIRNRLRAYVGSAADQIVASVPVAVGPAGFGDLRQLLLGGEFGMAPDSLGAVYRLNVGDIELGAKFLAFERGNWAGTAGAPSPWMRTRLSLQAIVRLGTGTPTLPRLPHRYLEYGTGDGQTDVEGAALLDLGLGRRIVVAAAARYTAQLGAVDAGRVPDETGVVSPFTPLHEGTRRLGDVLVGELTPRVLIGRYFGADAHYAIIVRGDDEYSSADGGAPLRRGGFTEQRVGVGITYSTLRGARGRPPRIPVEVSAARIETIAGSSGAVPQAWRNQIELRLYYSPWRRR